jgi:hypothetical protein
MHPSTLRIVETANVSAKGSMVICGRILIVVTTIVYQVIASGGRSNMNLSA